MAITRTAFVDDDGTGTTGTVINNAVKTELYDQIDAADALKANLASPTLTGTPAAPTAAVGTTTTQLATTAFVLANAPTVGSTAPTTTGNITAEPIPTGAGVLSTFHNNATLKTIQGMAAGTHGQIWLHYSIGAGQVDVAHLNASGTALGKCRNFATSAATSMAAGVGFMAFQYDNGVLSGVTAHWRLIFHEQGDWITSAFNAADYTGSGATNFSWTLTSGDRAGQAYWLRGRQLTVTFSLDTTSVVASPAAISTDLRILNTGWGNFTGSGQQFGGAIVTVTDNGVGVDAFIQANAGATFLRILKKTLANWTASTNNTAAYGMIVLGVA